jgi:hypothetical protein
MAQEHLSRMRWQAAPSLLLRSEGQSDVYRDDEDGLGGAQHDADAVVRVDEAPCLAPSGGDARDAPRPITTLDAWNEAQEHRGRVK